MDIHDENLINLWALLLNIIIFKNLLITTQETSKRISQRRDGKSRYIKEKRVCCSPLFSHSNYGKHIVIFRDNETRSGGNTVVVVKVPLIAGPKQTPQANINFADGILNNSFLSSPAKLKQTQSNARGKVGETRNRHTDSQTDSRPGKGTLVRGREERQLCRQFPRKIRKSGFNALCLRMGTIFVECFRW